MKQHGNIASKFLRSLMSVVLVLGMCGPLTGCKYTDVLTEIKIDQENGELNEHLDPIYKDVDDSDPDPDKNSTHENETTNVAEQINNLPQYDQNPNNEEETEQRDYQEDTDKDYNATEGEEASEKDGDNEGSNSTSGIISNLLNLNKKGNGGSEGQGGNENSDTTLTPSENNEGEQGENGATKDTTNNNKTNPGDSNTIGDDGSQGPSQNGAEIYGEDGTSDNLPHEGSIAAVGQYALIVQMLGGRNALAAADSEWLNNIRSTGAFPGEGLENVSVGWSGSASGGYTANIQAIINSGAKIAIIERNCSYLSASDIQTLIAAGVNVVHMPKLGDVDTPDNDINTAVRSVGEMLKYNTNGNSATMANAYINFKTSTMREVSNANGGIAYKTSDGASYNFIYQNQGEGVANKQATKATAFINSWASFTVSSFLAAQNYNGVGGYLENVTVDATDGVGLSMQSSTNSRSNTCALLEYYLQYAGVADFGLDSTYVLDTPYVVMVAAWRTNIGDILSVRHVARAFTNHGLWAAVYGDFSNPSSWITVGDDSFPACITRNSTYAQRIVNSANKSNGVYNSGQSYEVYVMPSGIAGSWADATVESFLASPWSYCMFQADKNLSDCTDYIDNFYSTFYRISYQDAYSSGALSGYGEVYTAGPQWQ